MRHLAVIMVALLLSTSVAGNNMSSDLQSYIYYLWKSSNSSFPFLSTFKPKLELKKLVELFRGQMLKPFSALGLPVLDPLQLHHIPFNVDHKIGRYIGCVGNLTALHLSQFEMENLVLNLNDFKVDFIVTFKRIPLSAVYEFKGFFANLVSTWGIGNFELEVHDMKLFGSLQVGTDREHIYMQSFNMDFAVRKVTGEIRGIFGEGELGHVVGEVIVELLPLLVDEVRPELSPWLSQQFLKLSNQRLNDLAFKKSDIVQWIREIATDNVLRLTRHIKRDLSPDCSVRTLFLPSNYCSISGI